jgi:hypothetical protein
LRWRRNKLTTCSWAILYGMGSDVSRMAYRYILDECEMWSSDEGKLDAKTGVQAPYLSPGFGDFGRVL